MNSTKQELKASKLVTNCDFSENYFFVVQDEAQNYYRSNEQTTILPFMIHFKNEKEIKHLSYTIISECLEHNTIALYLKKAL